MSYFIVSLGISRSCRPCASTSICFSNFRHGIPLGHIKCRCRWGGNLDQMGSRLDPTQTSWTCTYIYFDLARCCQAGQLKNHLWGQMSVVLTALWCRHRSVRCVGCPEPSVHCCTVRLCNSSIWQALNPAHRHAVVIAELIGMNIHTFI